MGWKMRLEGEASVCLAGCSCTFVFAGGAGDGLQGRRRRPTPNLEGGDVGVMGIGSGWLRCTARECCTRRLPESVSVSCDVAGWWGWNLPVPCHRVKGSE